MNIAVCDDMEYISRKIKNILQKENAKMKIDCFSNGCDLINSMQNTGYDIVYLDIEMPDLNGIKTAEKLQKINHSVIIIFVSSYSCYITSAFRINAFQFLLKDDLSERDVIFEYYRALGRYNKEHYKYKINQKTGVSYFGIDNIAYIESANRHLYAHFSDDSAIEFRGKLDKEEQKLDAYNFVRVHESFLVNVCFVTTVKSDRLIVDTKAQKLIPVSRKYKENLLNTYNLFNVGCMI